MKKILNLLASISLVATGASNVIACGSSSNTDQNLVNDVVNKLQGKSFAVKEDLNGDHNFGEYNDQILQEVKQYLSSNEKDLVSFLSSEGQKKINAEKITMIDLHIQSHLVQKNINIPVKLNNDAESIAQNIDGKTVGVLQKGVYQSPQLASKYNTEITDALLTKTEQANGYQILLPQNSKIYWPYWDENADMVIDPNQPINIKVIIGQDQANASIKLDFTYWLKFRTEITRIDNPANGSKANYIPISTFGKNVPAKDWQEDQIKESLDTGWGLGDFADYVSYIPITLIYNKLTPVYLHCPKLFVGYRLFWVLPY